MSSIVRPSMWGTVRLTCQRRASGPSTASMMTARPSHANTARGSGWGPAISAAARNATTIPDAVRRWTDHPRTRSADVAAASGAAVGASVRALDHLLRRLALLRLRRLLRLLGRLLGLEAQLDQHREMIGADLGQTLEPDQREVVGMEDV